jgi:hypothetical protein
MYLDADPECLEDVDGAVGLVLWQGQLEILEAVAPRGTSPSTELPRDRTSLKGQKSYTVKKKVSCFFPSPAGMSLAKLSLGGNNLIIPVQGEFG